MANLNGDLIMCEYVQASLNMCKFPRVNLDLTFGLSTVQNECTIKHSKLANVAICEGKPIFHLEEFFNLHECLTGMNSM